MDQKISAYRSLSRNGGVDIQEKQQILLSL